jgi:D-alanyl-D-alanine carboxypeptidase
LVLKMLNKNIRKLGVETTHFANLIVQLPTETL